MKQQSRLLFFLLAFLLFLASAKSQSAKPKPPFRIVDYYTLPSVMSESLNAVLFDKLTHINLWFLNPDSTGKFVQDFPGLLCLFQPPMPKT